MSSALNATITELIAGNPSKFLAGSSADTMWLFLCGFLVFFMQCGFALLEAGTVRAKNTKNILLKNLLDACVGACIWYMFGFTLALDPGKGFIGGSEGGGKASPSVFLWAQTDSEDPSGYTYAFWFFQYVFAAAAATIVSGAMAERTALGGYLVYTTIITGFIYPVVVHWVWSGDGWASCWSSGYWSTKVDAAGVITAGYPILGGCIDFAGSGVVHMTGGVAALVGAKMVGPRTGRFDEKFKPLPMPGHSTTLQVMGTFILWLGWYGFNPGSTLKISPDGYSRDAARVVVTTTMSAAMGGLTNILLEKLLGDHTWSVGAACNGILAGLVGITAGCASMYPHFAVLVGLISGFVYFGVSKLVLHKLKIDDPLDAFAVHGACGFWGVVAAALFVAEGYDYRVIFPDNGATKKGGLFTTGNGEPLGSALATLSAEIAWVGTLSFIMFGSLKAVGVLRVSAEMEAAGMDVSKHGGAAYETASA